jgi:hypothetical protein
MRSDPERHVVTTTLSPSINSGTTQALVDSHEVSLARVSYDRPRPFVAYAFWDPYKNNPGPGASRSIVTSVVGTEIVALGRIKFGNQQTMIEFNFDLPWGQLIAIPVAAEQVEITGRLINRVPITFPPANPTYQAFNDPPPFVLAPGDTFPNPSPSFPNGFVALTAGIGEFSSGPSQASLPQRSIVIPSLGAAGGGSDLFVCPIGYGARRVIVVGDPGTLHAAGPNTVSAQIAVQAGAFIDIPLNTTIPMPINATTVLVKNLAAAPTNAITIIYELGI